MVDATIIHAPSSTKNQDEQCDREMHQTRKGKQWYLGMKAHVGVDSKMKIIHTVVATPANVADSVVLPELLHGEETRVWGDGAYQGQTEVIRQAEVRIREGTLPRAEEERSSAVCHLRAGEPVCEPQKADASRDSVEVEGTLCRLRRRQSSRGRAHIPGMKSLVQTPTASKPVLNQNFLRRS